MCSSSRLWGNATKGGALEFDSETLRAPETDGLDGSIICISSESEPSGPGSSESSIVMTIDFVELSGSEYQAMS